MSHIDVQRENIPSQGNSRTKDPKVDVALSKMEEKPGSQVGIVPVSRRVGRGAAGSSIPGGLAGQGKAFDFTEERGNGPRIFDQKKKW